MQASGYTEIISSMCTSPMWGQNPVSWLKKKINYFNWRIITLQYCDAFCHTSTWVSYRCTCVRQSWIPHSSPSPPHLSGLSQSTDFGCPAPCIELAWSSILHMVIYMFQCYSLKLSHFRLLPQSPKVCSLHLCLFCCLVYRIVITIFVNSIYMCYYTELVFLFLTYFTLYDRFQFIHLIRTDSNVFPFIVA